MAAPMGEGHNLMRIGSKAKAIGTVLASGVLVLGIATSASATTRISANSYGYGEWNADPAGTMPGDSLRACDTDADGYGVVARLYNSSYEPIRTATTSGLSAGQCSKWMSGNLTEGQRYTVMTYRVQGGNEIFLNSDFVYA
ncbi:hypothetical protein ACIRJR_32355 [Streptomyces sp. NPDC102402]|uniref:hypothetical protein n=1 Tax=Streptomyces sp. NPDC102402 TaxID=3366169 RepID=UPI00380AD0E9